VTLERMGNRAPSVAPQGLYRCLGLDSWLAISVETDQQWQALHRVLGESEWADDPRLKTLEGRSCAHDALDEHLSAWAATRDSRATAEVLLEAGVPAASARDPRALYDHPQFVSRGFHEPFVHATVGARLAPTLPFRFESVSRWLRRAAPRFGEHNRAVLREILDLSETTIQDFETRGVIAELPNV
jgi:crotonobetainyl-CoA:carnitine CoA-transferase CaiB-like acyl-CoA transferase